MKTNKYVWVVNGDFGTKVLRFPCQIRKFAKDKGFSAFDESCTRFDMIVFYKKNIYREEKGFYALRYEVE